MVANIRSRPSPSGALYYNKEKVDKDEAEVLLWQKMLEPFDRYGRMVSMPTWRVSFEYDFIFRAKYRTVYCDPNFTSEADSFY